MFGRRGLFQKGGGARQEHRRTPFEPEGSLRSVRNAVPRGTGSVPLDAIVAAIRRSERDHGRASLTNLERWLLEGYNLEAYALHHGGFDYYLAHIDGPENWADASAALYAMELEDAAAVMRRAVELFLTHDHERADQTATRNYLDQMDSLGGTFAGLVPDLEVSLAQFADRFYPFDDRG